RRRRRRVEPAGRGAARARDVRRARGGADRVRPAAARRRARARRAADRALSRKRAPLRASGARDSRQPRIHRSDAVKRVAALLVLLIAPAAKAATPAVDRLLHDHCAGCHDDSSTLDLRAVPPESDKRTWMRILEMVQSFKMPPPPKSRSLAGHFP